MKKANKGFRNGGIFGGAIDESRRLILYKQSIEAIEDEIRNRLKDILIFRNRLSKHILASKKKQF